MSGGWCWMRGMSENVEDKWWTSRTEHRCPKCGGCAMLNFVLLQRLRMSEQEIREQLNGYPFGYDIHPWKDGKGCNVVLQTESNVNSITRPNPELVLLCHDCHARTELPTGTSYPPPYWKMSTRHGTLWAYNRKHLIAIRDHIQLERRPQGFIKLPGWMVAGKNRDEIVKLINRALEDGLTGG